MYPSSVQVYSVLQLLELAAYADYIPTGSLELDELLGGGLRCGSITELYGDVGSGKTKVCLELLVNAVVFDDEYSSIYISMKADFFPEVLETRIDHIVKTMNEYNSSNGNKLLNSQEILSRIHYVYASNREEMSRTIEEIIAILNNGDKLKLIIIDTLSDCISIDCKRSRKMDEILEKLELMASKNVAVFLTSRIVKCEIVMSDGSVRRFNNSLLDRCHYRDRFQQTLFVEKLKNDLFIYVIRNMYREAGGGSVKLKIDEHLGLN